MQIEKKPSFEQQMIDGINACVKIRKDDPGEGDFLLSFRTAAGQNEEVRNAYLRRYEELEPIQAPPQLAIIKEIP